MSNEVPFLSYISLYIVSFHILNCNSKSSTHWKLRLEDGKVLGLDPQPSLIANEVVNGYDVNNRPSLNDLGHMYQNEQHKRFGNDLQDNIGDTVFNILVSTILYKGLWIKNDNSNTKGCDSPDKTLCKDAYAVRTQTDCSSSEAQNKNLLCNRLYNPISVKHSRYSCDPKVNFTEYDNLSGIANRHNHPSLPEPDALRFFQKKKGSKRDINLKAVEKLLERSMKEKPLSRNTLHQIGNYWRVKGNTQNSIECFRKILKQQPNDKEALLSLGRIIFQLGYLEDAAFIIRRSIELAQNHPDAYLHHFTLGEILKAYGHYYEASLYFKQTLILNPDYQPASELLNDLQSLPETSVHAYTLFIIAFLVLAVLLGVLSTIEVVSGVSEDSLGSSSGVEVTKTQRHFNRAMAMRSMKLAVNSRPFRFRK